MLATVTRSEDNPAFTKHPTTFGVGKNRANQARIDIGSAKKNTAPSETSVLRARDMKTAAFPMNVIVVRRSFLQQNRDLVKRFQQAYAEATYQLLNHKDKATAVLTKRLQQKNPKAN